MGDAKGYAIENLGNGVTTIVAEMARMRHEIAQLKGELERVQTESADAFHHRDKLPPYPSNSELLVRLSEENEQLKDELVQQSITLRAEHQRAEQILDALWNPSPKMRDAVMSALNNRAVTDPIIGEDIDEIIEAAVVAAEREVDA